MRSLAIAVLFCAAGLAHSQGSANPPAAPHQPDPLFQARPLQTPSKPQFRWQDPDRSHLFFNLQPPEVHVPAKPPVNLDVDPGILRKPQGFAQPPARPAPQGKVYPDLKIQPIEIAQLSGPSNP